MAGRSTHRQIGTGGFHGEPVGLRMADHPSQIRIAVALIFRPNISERLLKRAALDENVVD
jgi:hypothetical protein